MDKRNEVDVLEILGRKEPLCFLVGAGVSMDAPASLASARQLMEGIIKFAAPEKFQSRLAALPNVRYEILVQQYKTFIDKDLAFLRYFDDLSLEDARGPNPVHQYLAMMLLDGHPVMTTNFDHFIERAVGLGEPRLRAAITPADFDQLGDVARCADQGLAVLYKLHGSPHNAITGEDTRETVITTIDALGKSKEGDFFAVEVFKRSLFDHVCDGRVLVVMGYSGGDDFDVVPMLHRLKGARAVIWINHVPHRGNGNPGDTGYAVTRVAPVSNDGDGQAGKVEHHDPLGNTLAALARRLAIDVFRVDAPTGAFIALASARAGMPLAGDDSALGTSTGGGVRTSNDVVGWLARNVPSPPPVARASFASSVFQVMGFPDEAVDASMMALEAATHQNDKRGIALALASVATLKHLARKATTVDVLAQLQRAHDLLDSIGDERAAAGQLVAMGMIHAVTGGHANALQLLDRGRAVFEKHGFHHGVGNALMAEGNVLQARGNMKQAIEHYRKAIALYERIGDLGQISSGLCTLAKALGGIGDVDAAMAAFQQALAIQERLGDWPGAAHTLSTMAAEMEARGHDRAAIDAYTRAKDIYTRISDIAGAARTASLMGGVQVSAGNLSEGRSLLEGSKREFARLDDDAAVAMQDVLLAKIDAIEGKHDIARATFAVSIDALERMNRLEDAAMACHDAWDAFNSAGSTRVDDAIAFATRMEGIHVRRGSETGVAEALVCRGSSYMSAGSYATAIEALGKAWRLARASPDTAIQVHVLQELGQAFKAQGRIFKAISCVQKALDRSQSMMHHADAFRCTIELAYLCSSSGKHDDAVQHAMKARNMAVKHGLQDRARLVADTDARIAAIHGAALDAIVTLEDKTREAGLSGEKARVATLKAMIALFQHSKGIVEAEFTMGTAVDAARGAGDEELVALLLDEQATLHASKDDFRLATRYYSDAIKAYERVDDAESAAVATGNLGAMLFQQGQLPEALAAWEGALRLMDPFSKARDKATIAGNCAAVHLRQGNAARAVELYQEAIGQLAPLEDEGELARAHFNLGMALVKASRLDRARETLQQARSLAITSHDAQLERAIDSQLARLAEPS